MKHNGRRRWREISERLAARVYSKEIFSKAAPPSRNFSEPGTFQNVLRRYLIFPGGAFKSRQTIGKSTLPTVYRRDNTHSRGPNTVLTLPILTNLWLGRSPATADTFTSDIYSAGFFFALPEGIEREMSSVCETGTQCHEFYSSRRHFVPFPYDKMDAVRSREVRT